MNLNWKEIDRILAELDLEGAQIQDCIQSEVHSLYLQCYKKREVWVHLHLRQPFPCICEGNRPKKPSVAQRFQTFLRAHIKNTYITSIQQHGMDRIIILTCVRSGTTLHCFIPLWTGKTNFIVCDASMHIIDACFRKPKQGIIAGALYTLPEKSKEVAEKSIREHSPPLSKHIAKQLSTLAHEKESQSQLQLQEKIINEIHRLNTLLRKKELQIPSDEAIAAVQHQADLFLTARMDWHQGMSSISVHDYTTDTEVEIPLSVQASFKENADILFQKAKKLRAKQENISLQITALQKEVTLFSNAVDNLDDPSVCLQMQKKLTTVSPTTLKSASGKSKSAYSGRIYKIHGYDVYLGRNARQNETLIRTIARGNDIWLHSRDYAGSHVIVKGQKKNDTIPHQVLADAAKLALFFSKGRKNVKGDVYVCAVKHLRKKKHGVFGEYIPHQERNLYVSVEGVEKFLNTEI